MATVYGYHWAEDVVDQLLSSSTRAQDLSDRDPRFSREILIHKLRNDQKAWREAKKALKSR